MTRVLIRLALVPLTIHEVSSWRAPQRSQKLAGSARGEISVAHRIPANRPGTRNFFAWKRPAGSAAESLKPALVLKISLAPYMEALFNAARLAAMSLLLRSDDVCNERVTYVTITFRL
jgi:hypothetical protein